MGDRKPKPLFTLFRAILLLFTGDDSPKKPFLHPRSEPKTLVCLQDESILSTGRKRQGVKQPGVWRGACVVSPSSRKEQKENTTALKSVAPTGLGEREILFTLCGASLPGDIESQRRVQRENSAFAKRKREKIRHGGSELFVLYQAVSCPVLW